MVGQSYRRCLLWLRLDRHCVIPVCSTRDRTSGVTSKPAIEGHFKTGQRTTTLDELVLPYRLAVWQVQFGPVRSFIVRPEMPAALPSPNSAGPDSSLRLPSPEAAL